MLARRSAPSRAGVVLFALYALFALAPIACSDDDDPAPPPPPASLGKERTRDQGLPGIGVEMLQIRGGSGGNGAFVSGDSLSVTFQVKTADGQLVDLADLDYGGIMVSGPTSNYQRVIALQTDLRERAVRNGDNSFTYTFAQALPDTYLAPINDTAAFGAADGELQGEPLHSGTYTVGIELYKEFLIEGTEYRDTGNAVADFVVAGTGSAATAIEPRDVVGQANCNQCHGDLREHGGRRTLVAVCVLCHTAGSEDRNDPLVENGTPGVSIDFKVMIHRIHNGAHLPSVLGVATNPDGSRNYAATPRPYKIVAGSSGRVTDFSGIRFPEWPYANIALPRDFGYAALGSTEKSLEDTMRTGAAQCGKCHGDPDGAGPAPQPAQGVQALTNPTRAACGSCHDDIDWNAPYVSNMLRMPPQTNDATCALCHPGVGSILGVVEGHLHPLLDPAVDPGLAVTVAAVREGGTSDQDGTLDPGEKIEIDLQLRDRNGQPVDPSTMSRLEFAVSGPSGNRNILAESLLPLPHLSGPDATTFLPERVFLESVGRSTASLGDQFTTQRAPHWDVQNAAGQSSIDARTKVWKQTATGATTSLGVASKVQQNWLDVADPSGFARDDHIVVDPGTGTEEYLRIQTVEGDRLWFSSIHGPYDKPATRFGHAAGATVREVTLTQLVENTDYSLSENNGVVTELVEIGTNTPVLVTYTTDYVIPAIYPTAINDTPDLTDSSGKWAGKPVVDGTYTVGVWGGLGFTVSASGEVTSYTSVSPAGTSDFLVGSATTLQPAAIIDSEQSCYVCHSDMWFHGNNRRGFATCILCHGSAGAEDRPQYVAPGAPATTGLTIEFRSMLHSIHRGADLANAGTYGVVGFGSGSYPNNFSLATYDHVEFPVAPGGVQQCVSCHGESSTAWDLPAPRNHPTDQARDTLSWTIACSSCHDSSSALAHIAVQTSPSGGESCAVCHDRGKDMAVERVHRTW